MKQHRTRSKESSATPTPEEGRAFFLAVHPDRGVAELEPEDAAHARRVLRLGVGDTLVGLDGEGGRWPLRVSRSSGGSFEVEATGEPLQEPRPGELGAPLPWIELAVSLPREKRAEAMLDRLVQLGASALTPLWCERSQGPLRELSETRSRRLLRTAREACKQCGRSWLPILHPTCVPADLLGARPRGPVALLDPDAAESLLEWAREIEPGTGTEEAPLLLIVGPEGGFSEAERADLVAGGARPVGLGPHTLRIETAAEAGLAGLALALGAPARP